MPEQTDHVEGTEGLRRWTVPVCIGCGGVMPTSCTCEKSHAKTGLSVPVVAVPDLVKALTSEEALNAMLAATGYGCDNPDDPDNDWNQGWANEAEPGDERPRKSVFRQMVKDALASLGIEGERS